ncbi:MAG: hypothetical protein H6502_02880 [Candidatus Woesearchaeota archaeon]|nr:MAG: hypothetical protein H6502_02880 [Candidatus Woesearchaeota archaeon]
MFIQKNNFIIRLRKEDEGFFDNINFVEVYKFVEQFYQFEKKMMIKLNVISSVEEYTFFTNNQFKEWVCACAGPHNSITIFSPSVIAQLTIHHPSRYPYLLVHELSHLFYGNARFRKIALFDEGIASYLAKKYSKEEVTLPEKIPTIPTSLIFPDQKSYYVIGPYLIKKIIETYGKQKLFSFLKIQNDTTPIYKAFEQHFGKTINAFLKE